MQYTNQLINESSPYLLQHAHNPVNWMAWNNESWQKARDENKLVIISIGYSACHWCHVMEHESFEDTAVAQLMNEHFICIKVDREERPDVDQIYMDAVQLISGSGGWPLNAIALPDARPIYAGTYFATENWKQVLNYFVDYWKNNRAEALERAEEITKGIKQMDVIATATSESQFTANDRTLLFTKIDANWDYERGGRRGAPKFPMPVTMQYLLQNYFYTKNTKALTAVTTTLNAMMNGGIYDQVGGGFARYSVDADWEIPHFEKMLYDNAQLVSLYSHAYQLTGSIRYKETVYETLAFIAREMTDICGGFYAAQDADSEGEEGKFYVWTVAEIKGILQQDFEAFQTVFNATEDGNFEGRNNITRKQEIENSSISKEQINTWKQKILTERDTRIRPLLDDKILTSWNALMIKGYIDAYKVFGEKSFLNTAIIAGNFIIEKVLKPDFSLLRNYKNGKATITAFLDDYSFTCEAFIALYESTLDEKWLNLSKQITEYVIQHFYNVNTGMFFYTSLTDEPLIARKTEMNDNVIASSNSSMAKVLFKLGALLSTNDYAQKSYRALSNMQENMLSYTSYYSNWAILSDSFITQPFEVAIIGKNALLFQQELNQHYLPNCLVMGAISNNSILPLLQDKYKDGETLIYICVNKTCGLPVNTVAEALQIINAKHQ